MAGRPTKMTQELEFMIEDYLNSYQDLDQVVPTIVGLCSYINISKSTVYKWKEENKSQILSDTLERIEEVQCVKLINGGLSNKFNSAITKLLLANHGFTEKVQQDNISSDGSHSADLKVTVVRPDKK
jgi:IS30 family transposase